MTYHVSRIVLAVVALVALLATASTARADAYFSAKITSIGCHMRPSSAATQWPTLCTITLDRDLPTSSDPRDSSCQAQRRELRFDTTQPLGKEVFSLLNTAYLAGKTVTFGMYPGYWCSTIQTSYPTFGYAVSQ